MCINCMYIKSGITLILSSPFGNYSKQEPTPPLSDTNEEVTISDWEAVIIKLEDNRHRYADLVLKQTDKQTIMIY